MLSRTLRGGSSEAIPQRQFFRAPSTGAFAGDLLRDSACGNFRGNHFVIPIHRNLPCAHSLRFSRIALFFGSPQKITQRGVPSPKPEPQVTVFLSFVGSFPLFRIISRSPREVSSRKIQKTPFQKDFFDL